MRMEYLQQAVVDVPRDRDLSTFSMERSVASSGGDGPALMRFVGSQQRLGEGSPSNVRPQAVAARAESSHRTGQLGSGALRSSLCDDFAILRRRRALSVPAQVTETETSLPALSSQEREESLKRFSEQSKDAAQKLRDTFVAASD